MFNITLRILTNIIATLFIALFLFVLEFDLNDYKQQITELVKNKTGRTLQIKGNIALAFYPQISLDVENISLSNYLAESKFAEINKLQLAIKLLPLLYQHIEIESVFLDNLELNLVRDSNSTNWDDLIGKETAKSSYSFQVNKIKLDNANITLDEQGSLYTISQANFIASTLAIQFNSVIALDGKLNGKIELNSKISLDKQQYKLTQFRLSVQSDTTGKILLNTKQLNINLSEQILDINQLVVQSLGTQLNGQLRVKQMLSKPIASGEIKLTSANLRRLVKRFQPTLAFIPPLQPVELTTEFNYASSNIGLNNLQLKIDDNQFQTPKINIDLTNQTIDLPQFFLQVLGIKSGGNLSVTQLFEQPILQGKLLVKPFNPQQLLASLPPIQLPSYLPLNKISLQTELTATADDFVFKQVFIKFDANEFNSERIDFYNDKLNLNNFIVRIFDVKTTGNLFVTQLFNEPKLHGSLQVDKFNPRHLLASLEQAPLDTTDPTVLQTLKLTTDLQGNLSQLNLENVEITLDDSNLIGNISIDKQITFHFDVDNIEISRYLPSTTDDEPTPLSDIKILQTLDVNGTLKVRSMKIIGVEINDIYFKVKTNKNGKIQIYPKNF